MPKWRVATEPACQKSEGGVGSGGRQQAIIDTLGHQGVNTWNAGWKSMD